MSGRRAAYKVAMKNARRNRKRTVFLVLLVAVPVALGVVIAGIVRASGYTPEEAATQNLGAADVRMDMYAAEPDVKVWFYDQVGRLGPGVQTTEFRETGIRLEGLQFATATDIDMSSPLAEGKYLLLDGRLPTADDEVALSPTTMEILEVSVGDSYEFEDLEVGPLTLVGSASEPVNTKDLTIILAPGSLEKFEGEVDIVWGTTVLMGGDGAEDVSLQINELWWSQGRQQFWPEPAISPKPNEIDYLEDEIYFFLTESEINQLVDLAKNTDSTEEFDAVSEAAWEMVYQDGPEPEALSNMNFDFRTGFLSQPRFEENPALISTGATALLLVEVAFITGAAFAAGTRRRLREIGLMGANGASESQVKRTVIGEGLTIGLIGSGVGVVLGIAVLLLGRPIIQRYVTRLLTGLGVSVTDLLGPVAVALLSVLVAVWIPARTASKVPTTTALQGRMPASSPRKWVVPLGIALAGLGALLITVGLASTSNFANALVGVAAVMVVGGVALMSSPILAGVARFADLAPATGRLVIRDSGRNRTRAAVAVAAIMVVLLIPVVFLTMQSTSAERDLIYGLPSPENHLLVRGEWEQQFGGNGSVTDADIANVAAIVPEAAVAKFEGIGVRVKTKETMEAALEGESFVEFGGDSDFAAAVESEELIALLAHDGVRRSLAADEIVVLGLEDKDTIVEINGAEYPAKEYAVPVYRWSMPRILLPVNIADQFSDADRQEMALFILERSLTDAEFTELYSTLELEINGGSSELSEAVIYGIAMGATLVVVLIVVALVTAVSAAEVDQEVRTIVAVGAPGSYRRRFLGLLTGYQTAVAVALAVPLGVGLVKVFSSASESFYVGFFGIASSTTVIVPWWQLGIFLIAIPIVIGLLTLISVRSAPVTPPRRAT